MKRPAAMKSAGSAAPAAMKSAGMTEDKTRKRDQEQEAQNEQLNKCLEKALSQLSAQETKARKVQLNAKRVGAGSKPQEVHEQELGRCVGEIAILIDRLKDVTVTKTSALYVPDKVDLPENT